MDGFPSGQRERTVNPLSQTTMVRIHPRPPKHKAPCTRVFCVFCVMDELAGIWNSRHAAIIHKRFVHSERSAATGPFFAAIPDGIRPAIRVRSMLIRVSSAHSCQVSAALSSLMPERCLNTEPILVKNVSGLKKQHRSMRMLHAVFRQVSICVLIFPISFICLTTVLINSALVGFPLFGSTELPNIWCWR